MNEFSYQAGVAVMAVHFINWMKETKWIPFIDQHSTLINRLVAFAAAIVGGLGMHFAAQGDFTSGGTLQITYPPLDVMVAGLVHIAFQWGIQQSYFRLQGPPLDTALSVTTISPLGSKGATIGVTEAHSFPASEMTADKEVTK
jgi:hypothetical protein